jgi:hypothetical protein
MPNSTADRLSRISTLASGKGVKVGPVLWIGGYGAGPGTGPTGNGDAPGGTAAAGGGANEIDSIVPKQFLK